jgi:hypothetical protein
MKKGTTIGEMYNLPNRVSHTIYYQNYKQQLADWKLQKKDPKAAEQKAMGEALESTILGG